MKEVNVTASENELKISLSGRIDSNNAREAESEIMKYAEQNASLPVVVDAEGLEYISSAGLRVLAAAMDIMEDRGEMFVANANDDVRDVFEITGFIEDLNMI